MLQQTIWSWLAWASAHPLEVLGALVLVMAGSMVAVGLVAVYGAFLRWSNEDEAEAGRERARPAMPGPKSVRRKVS